MKKRRTFDREFKQMVVNGFAENNVYFEAILISHPKFYRRKLGWDVYKE